MRLEAAISIYSSMGQRIWTEARVDKGGTRRKGGGWSAYPENEIVVRHVDVPLLPLHPLPIHTLRRRQDSRVPRHIKLGNSLFIAAMRASKYAISSSRDESAAGG